MFNFASSDLNIVAITPNIIINFQLTVFSTRAEGVCSVYCFVLPECSISVNSSISNVYTPDS